MSRTYRPEIDGLRALAVGCVIIYHMFDRFLPAGFLGVDIFFVISGYVVTCSLHEFRNASFTSYLQSFYVRRVKRIMPALLLCLLASSVVFAFFNPNPTSSIRTARSAVIAISNHYLLQASVDYDGDAAAANAFTHTWSLGVEEQFYIFFPILLWFMLNTKNLRFISTFIFVVLVVASFALYFILSSVNNTYAFYLMPTRFWELSLGVICALFEHRRKDIKISPVLIDLVFIALLYFLFLYPFAATFNRIVVVSLTAIVIFAPSDESMMYRVLASRPAITLGLLSYSLYLWHWPVIVISNLTIGSAPLMLVLQLTMTLILSWLSFNYVEQTCRRANWTTADNRTLFLAFCISVLCFGLLTILAGRFNKHMYLGERAQIEARGANSLQADYQLENFGVWRGKRCVFSDNGQVGQMISVDDCTLGSFDEARQRVLVIGNSFATTFVQAFNNFVVKDKNAVTITSSFGASVVPEIPNQTPWKLANDHYWEKVIPNLVDQLRPGDAVFIVSDIAQFSPPEITSNSIKALDLLERGLRRFAGTLNEQKISLYILHGLPFAREPDCDPDETIKQWFSVKAPDCRMPNRNETLNRRKPLDEVFSRLAADQMITVVDLLDVFCPEEECTYRHPSGVFVYRDRSSHPSIEAARLSAPIISRIISK